jgi:hypothetical protein
LVLLREAIELMGGDRGALLRIGELDGITHTNLLLDLVSDCPRRNIGIPPGLEVRTEAPRLQRTVDRGRWRLTLALESDGTHNWFLTVDGPLPRPRHTAEEEGGLNYLAGLCAAAVLHRDLDGSNRDVLAPECEPTLPGWPTMILKDSEGREGDHDAVRRMAALRGMARAERRIEENG